MIRPFLHALRVPALLLLITALPGDAGTPRGFTAGPRPIQPFFQTLFSNDPLRHTLSLATGAHGAIVQDYTIKNFDSELDFGNYLAHGLTAGVHGGQVGTVTDLGSQLDVAAKYGFEETVGLGQGFASIHFQGSRLMIRKDLAADTFQSFHEGNDLLHAPVPPGSVGVPAIANHLYLVRIVASQSGELIRFAKLLVTSVDGDRVALLFEPLSPRG